MKNKKKKKIIVYSPYYSPEPFPINSFVSELSSRKLIEEVLVITGMPNYRNYGYYKGFGFFGPYLIKSNKIKIIRLPIIPRFSNNFISIFLFYISFLISSTLFLLIYGLFNRKKYDHIITFCGSPIVVGYWGFWFSKIIKSKSSLWIQDIWPEAIETTVGLKNNFLKKLIKKIQNKMFLYCDVLFCESQSLSNYLKKRIKKKIVTLYNPIRTEKKNNILRNNKIKNFSYIGNMGKAQNVELIVKSFIKSNITNSILNMCGDGNLLPNLSKKYYKKQIKWHGWISGIKLDKIIDKSDFLIVSLNNKGRQSHIIPSKIQTYFMSNRPIICISKGAVSSLIKFTKSGLVSENFKISSAVKIFKKSSKLTLKNKRQMGKNAYEFYLSNFRKEKIVSEFLKNI